MSAPLITEIKGHSLDDGPGIRAVVFFKGCPLSCVWCHNPETIDPRPQLRLVADKCVGSGRCVAACPEQAIASAPLQIEPERCTRCGDCAAACDSGALTLTGQTLSVDALLGRLTRYRAFFRNSGGGVTLSGGEATMYPDYCGQLLREMGRQGIHRLLETCGLFDWTRVAQQMLPELETVYFDLKFIDDARHRRHCGRSNRRILENFDRLLAWASRGGTLLARVPLIPDLTTAPDNLAAIAEFLAARGIRDVALLPYNPLWHDKARQLGQAPRYAATRWLSTEELEQARQCFAGFTLH